MPNIIMYKQVYTGQVQTVVQVSMKYKHKLILKLSGRSMRIIYIFFTNQKTSDPVVNFFLRIKIRPSSHKETLGVHVEMLFTLVYFLPIQHL